jgi:hypothetical protein
VTRIHPGKLALCLGALVGLAGASPSCTPSPLGSGQYGRFRYVAKVNGDTPLRLLPPIADVNGNVYTLNGSIDFPETHAFISRVGGGEAAVCNINKGDTFGAHGWVGFAQDRAWYWSGDALVVVSQSGCSAVLDHDPGTDSNLLFRAVLPWVRDAPSQTSLVAMVQSPIDPLPFVVRVDLNGTILTNISGFTPTDATDVTVIGVGADREANTGFVLLQYGLGGNTLVEGRFYDAAANLTGIGKVATDPLPQYAVRGYLQRSSRGLVVGLLLDADGLQGSLVSFDASGGRIVPIGNGMKPVGVHVWNGNLFLVGTKDDHPVIAAIDNRGGVLPATRWTASENAAAGLAGSIVVIDDRTLPSRDATWKPVRTATGDFPFVSPHALTQHAPDTTLWVIAGPTFEFGGGTKTAFAMAPVGVSYP